MGKVGWFVGGFFTGVTTVASGLIAYESRTKGVSAWSLLFDICNGFIDKVRSTRKQHREKRNEDDELFEVVSGGVSDRSWTETDSVRLPNKIYQTESEEADSLSVIEMSLDIGNADNTYYESCDYLKYKEQLDSGNVVFELLFDISERSFYWTHTYEPAELSRVRGCVGPFILNVLGNLPDDYLDEPMNDTFMYIHNKINDTVCCLEIVDELPVGDYVESEDDGYIIIPENPEIYNEEEYDSPGFFNVGPILNRYNNT